MKTGRAFSAMAIDQAHEQNNAAVKGDGGAVGLTENPMHYKGGWSQAQRWPELLRSLQHLVMPERH